MDKLSKSPLKWTDVKAKLADFDRTGLLALIQDLYAADKRQSDVSSRPFWPWRGRSGTVYKETIDRWPYPDVFRKQDASVARAEQAIADYKKAVGQPGGLAELMVFFCERAAAFCNDLGNTDDESYVNALLVANTLPASDRDALIARLERVRVIGHNFGYGVGDHMDSMLGVSR